MDAWERNPDAYSEHPALPGGWMLGQIPDSTPAADRHENISKQRESIYTDVGPRERNTEAGFAQLAASDRQCGLEA